MERTDQDLYNWGTTFDRQHKTFTHNIGESIIVVSSLITERTRVFDNGKEIGDYSLDVDAKTYLSFLATLEEDEKIARMRRDQAREQY